MTELYKCDICGRIQDLRNAKDEDWHKVINEPFSRELGIREAHYCGRCWIFYCKATSDMVRMYEEIKGTKYDIYANKEGNDGN